MKILLKIISAIATIAIFSNPSFASATTTTDIDATANSTPEDTYEDTYADTVTDPEVATQTKESGEVPMQASLQPLVVISATARPSMDGSSNSAAYITLRNNGVKDITITGASSLDVANNLELHTIADEQGVKKMVKVDKLVVPAGGYLIMRKGGIHIMLMDLKKNLAIGSKFDIDIMTQEGLTQRINVLVRQM